MTTIGRVGGGMVLAAAALLSAPAMSQHYSGKVPCGDKISDELSAIGAGALPTSGVLSEQDWSHDPRADVFQGWTVWVSPKSCGGKVVFRLSPECVLQSVYTTGDCQFAGVQHSD